MKQRQKNVLIKLIKSYLVELFKFCTTYRFRKYLVKICILQRPFPERLQLFVKLVKERCRGKRVLIIAPNQHVLKEISEVAYQVVTIDKKANGYDYGNCVLRKDLTRLPGAFYNHFDIIICNAVLEHIENDIEAIGNIWMALNPNGTAFITVPIYMDLPTHEKYKSRYNRIKYYGQYDHVRLYGGDIVEKFAKFSEVKYYSYADKFDNLSEFMQRQIVFELKK